MNKQSKYSISVSQSWYFESNGPTAGDANHKCLGHKVHKVNKLLVIITWHLL